MSAIVLDRVQALPARIVMFVLAAVFAVGVLSAAACGCKGSATPPMSTAQTVARETVTTFEGAWIIGATGCLAEANTLQSDAVRQKCAQIFGPAHSALVLSAGLVDAWSDAAQATIGCALADLAASFGSASDLLTSLGVEVPPGFPQGIAEAQALIPACARPDAGASVAPTPLAMPHLLPLPIDAGAQ